MMGSVSPGVKSQSPVRLVVVVLVLVLSTITAIMAPAKNAIADGGSTTNRYVISLTQPPTNLSIGSTYHGGTVNKVLPALNGISVSSTDPLFKYNVSRDSTVRYIEPEQWLVLDATLPSDPLLPTQYAPQQVELPVAWDYGFGTTSAGVCVVDTGAELSHEDLDPSRYLGGYNVLDGSTNVTDDDGHGTGELGVAAATVNNHVGIAGAGNVGYYVVKASESLAIAASDLAAGITWCANNTEQDTVILIGAELHGYSQYVHDALTLAMSMNKLVVVAAGNDGITVIGNNGVVQANGCGECVGYPATEPGVLAVSCTGPSHIFCPVSSSGHRVTLAAPGDTILTTCSKTTSDYCVYNGTSMSAALVAGTAALYWSYHTSATMTFLAAQLNQTSRDRGDAGFDIDYGSGELDAGCLFQAQSPCETPPNDNFSSSQTISLLPYSAQATSKFATVEPGEDTSCLSIGSTVWFAWTAPAGGTLSVSAGGTGFTPVVTVSNGPSLANQTSDGCASGATGVQVTVTKGVIYYIRVGGQNGGSGNYTISASCTCPPNNDFANAIALNPTFSDWSTAESTVGADTEPGEQLLFAGPPSCGPIGATVWYNWHSPVTGTAYADTFGSNYNTVLTAYQNGSTRTPATIQELACNEGSGGTQQSYVSFPVIRGDYYFFQIGGYLSASGQMNFHLHCSACYATPLNDNFSAAKIVVGDSFTDAVPNINATTEPDEPAPCGAIANTVWYSFTPSKNSTATASTGDSNFDAVEAVYVGSDEFHLTNLGCSNIWDGSLSSSSVTFNAVAGTTYWIQSGGYNGTTGTDLETHLRCSTSCMGLGINNDDRANAVAIASLPYRASQDITGYTVEPGETTVPGTTHTAWWSYTVPASGTPELLQATTAGSLFYPTTLAVFTSGEYVPLGYSRDATAPGQASVTFLGLPGETYMIQGGGYNSAQGVIELNLAQVG
jgi:hypothetical protein